jgi:hypothetical protein
METQTQIAVFSGVINFESEDSGRALIAELEPTDENSELFVRLHSYADDPRAHEQAKQLEGKKVKVIIIADEGQARD